MKDLVKKIRQMERDADKNLKEDYHTITAEAYDHGILSGVRRACNDILKLIENPTAEE